MTFPARSVPDTKPPLEASQSEEPGTTEMRERPEERRLGPRLSFSVKNTFVEVEVDEDEQDEKDEPRRKFCHRRALSVPAVLPAMIDEADLAFKAHIEAYADDAEPGSETSAGLSEDVTSDGQTPPNSPAARATRGAPVGSPSADGVRFWSLDTTPASTSAARRFSETCAEGGLRITVRNTFVEVVEDSDGSEPPICQFSHRRARTEPFAHRDSFTEEAWTPMTSVDSTSSPHTEHSLAGGRENVLGRVWQLSQDADGCRAVQRALEVSCEEERVLIARELQGHVWDALEHPQANFVLQKAIVVLEPSSVQFIVDELMNSGSATFAARSRCGCRVIQRLLECCNRAQLLIMGEDLLSRALTTCKHRFGRYAMQCFAQHGLRQHVRQLVEILAEDISTACLDEYSNSVVAHLLAPGLVGDAERRLLSLAVIRYPGLPAQLWRWRSGSALVRLAIEVSQSFGDVDFGDLDKAGIEALLDMAAPPASSFAAAKKQRRGAGGGGSAQAAAEARDIVESLRSACKRRSSKRIVKAIERLEAAAAEPGAVPLLLSEGPLACMAARALLHELGEDGKLART